jgi:spore coat polysaccharide biosynthesis protein SpsF (cytidylyltransferase family)
MALLKVGVNILNNMAILVRVLGTNPFIIPDIVKEFGKSLGKR